MLKKKLLYHHGDSSGNKYISKKFNRNFRTKKDLKNAPDRTGMHFQHRHDRKWHYINSTPLWEYMISRLDENWNDIPRLWESICRYV